MTRRILFATAVLCAIFAGAALAADISGNWSGTLQMELYRIPGARIALMTRRILFATAVLCAIFAGAALAADISGNWSGTLQMADNPFTLTYAFKQDGEKLTGTVTGPGGEPLPLNDGKVVGDKVSFNVKVDMGGNPATFRSEGIVKGDEITLTTKSEGGPDCGGPVILKRVK